MELFYRKYKLTIGDPNSTGLLIDSLNISFDIIKSADEKLNKSFISIFNLSQASRDKITQDSVAKLEVAYGDSPYRILFAGDVADFASTREGANIVTKVSLIDGFIESREAFTSRSFPANTSVEQVIKTIVTQDLGLPSPTVYKTTKQIQTGADSNVFKGSYKGNIAYPIKGIEKSFNRPTGFHGKSTKVLTDICEANGLTWFIRNKNTVIVLPKGQSTTEQVQLISPSTGLIGSPEKHLARPNAKNTKTKAIGGYKFRTLLNPFIEPGNSLKLEAEGVDSIVKVLKLRHRGEYEGQDWTTEYEVEVID